MGLGPNVNLFKRGPKNWGFEGGQNIGALQFRALLTALILINPKMLLQDINTKLEGRLLTTTTMEWLTNRWTTVAASILIQSSCGSYTFGIYSPLLKSTQSYSQSTLDTISVFKDMGSNFGFSLASFIRPSHLMVTAH